MPMALWLCARAAVRKQDPQRHLTFTFRTQCAPAFQNCQAIVPEHPIMHGRAWRAPHLPLEVSHLVLVRGLELLKLAFERRDLDQLALLTVAAEHGLQVFGHAQQLELLGPLDELVNLELGFGRFPLQHHYAAPEAENLAQDLHLLGGESIDLLIKLLDDTFIDEQRLREIGHHRRLHDLQLPLLQLEGQLSIPAVEKLCFPVRLDLRANLLCDGAPLVFLRSQSL
eukprot:2561629-Pleurochrysis_carterae.AAC.5